MDVSVTEAKKKLSQLLAAVENGERVTIRRRGRAIAELVPPEARKQPKFGTLKGIVEMTDEQFYQATRAMTREEADGFIDGSY